MDDLDDVQQPRCSTCGTLLSDAGTGFGCRTCNTVWIASVPSR